MKRIKAFIKMVKDSIARQIETYKKGNIIQRRSTKLRTVVATAFCILSILALIPSFFHILFDMIVHGPAMLTSFLSYRVCEAIH